MLKAHLGVPRKSVLYVDILPVQTSEESSRMPQKVSSLTNGMLLRLLKLLFSLNQSTFHLECPKLISHLNA